MADEPRPRAPRPRKAVAKAPAKKAPAKPAAPTAADRRKAAGQIASVTPIKRPPRPKSARPRTAPESLLLDERRREALGYRRLGLQWAEVAAKIREQPKFGTVAPKYSAADAYADARFLLDSVTIEAVQGVREEDLAVLLSLQRAVYPAALKGDVKAIRAMLDILDRRSKYLGLDSPVRLQLTGADDGPIRLDTTDETAIYEAAVDAVDDLLPHVDPIELPGASG